MPPTTDWTDMPFEQAVAYLRALHPMTDAEFAALEREAAAQAFTVARVTKIEMLQAILDKLTEGLQKGLTLSEFLSDANQVVEGALSDDRLAQVYQTNVQSAYGAGKWAQGTDPAIADEIWGWRYTTAGDDRVREEHAALDGMEFKTGEGDAVFPPWDFGCRCSAEWLTNAEMGDAAQSDELPSEVQDALDQSDFLSPAVMTSAPAPDLTSIDPRLHAAYTNDQPN